MAHTEGAEGKRVALFIDVLNQTGLNMDWIVNFAREWGQLDMAWAYGRFYRQYQGLPQVAQRLRQSGIRLMHCPTFTDIQNDTTDLFMMRDIFHTLVQRPDIDCFVVCTGDGGFENAIDTIRAHGRTAVVVGPPKATSSRLVAAANHFLIAPSDN